MIRLWRRWYVPVIWLLLLCGGLTSVRAQTPLSMTTTTLPSLTAGAQARVKIAVTGGSEPLTFRLTGGKLPPGLRLNPMKGTISGVPTAAGTCHFQVSVTDSSIPTMLVQREFTLVVTAALGIEWKQPPAVHGEKIDGSVVVTNYTQQDFTLTVIVMAVNQIGRATALGYQEFTLRSGGEQVIPFGSEPGPGTFIVHADAVAEMPSTNSIYRARKQTSAQLVIQEPD